MTDAEFYSGLAAFLDCLAEVVEEGPASLWRLPLRGQLQHAARCAREAAREAPLKDD